MIDSSYKILGLDRNASLSEIKLRYREMIKALHPDFNKSETATDEFIELTIAFDVVSGYKKGVYSKSAFSEEMIEKYKIRAARMSTLKYNAFIKTKYYKQTEALDSVLVHFHFVTSILIIIGAPLLGAIINGYLGFFFGLLIVFISVKYWASIFKNDYRINWSEFLNSCTLLVNTTTFQLIAGSSLNLWLLFGFTLYTEIATFVFLLIFVFVELFGYLIYAVFKNYEIEIELSKLLFIWTPLIFNIFFMINYTITTDKYIEQYHFTHKRVDYSQHWESSPRYERIGLILLEGGKYENFHWYRSFFDFENMKHASFVTYEFETGIFGIRVLKNTVLKP